MRLHIKTALNYTVYKATYAVPPCWCNYSFTHQSHTCLHSVYRLHTLYLLAGAIMRLHIKAAFPYTVYTGCIRCASLLVQLCVYTSKPHFLAQCAQATYAVPPCWCNHAFTHQSHTCLHSVYRLHSLYLLAGAIMRLHIKAAFPYTLCTGYIRCTSLLVQSCVYTSKPHLLTQCIQATYAVPPCWCNHAFTHQSHTCLHSVYRLHTLYLLAGAIMRLHIKAAFPYTVCTGYIRCTSLLVQSCVYTSRPQFLTQCIQATYAVPPCWCNYAFTHQSRTYLHSAYRLHTLYLLAGAIMRLHIKAALPYTDYIRCTSLLVQLFVYTWKLHFLACLKNNWRVLSRNVFPLQESYQTRRGRNGDERRHIAKQPPHKRQKQPPRGNLRAGEDFLHPASTRKAHLPPPVMPLTLFSQRQTMVWPSHQWQGLLSSPRQTPICDSRCKVCSRRWKASSEWCNSWQHKLPTKALLHLSMQPPQRAPVR